MSGNGYAGQQRPSDTSSEFNANRALVAAMLARVSTSTLVQVTACTNAGDLSPVGFVDVLPLVNQLDGAYRAVPHGIVHRLPYFRLQGGSNAVVIDPQPGDIGIAVFADRDISSVSASKAQANPGSGRRFDMADGLYIGGVLNGAPVQCVQFNSTGITITSPTQITLSAPAIVLSASASITSTAPSISSTAAASVINGPLSATGNIQSSGEIYAGTTPLHSHTHPGVAPGGSSTGLPSP